MDTQKVFSRYHNIISKYLEEISRVIIVMTDESLQIMDCNKGFLKSLNLASKPENDNLEKFLLPESLQVLSLPPPGEYMESRLNFTSGSATYIFSCYIFDVQNGYIIFGEKPVISSDDIILKMSTLNNELINMTRELNKKNMALEKANAEITRLSRIDAMTGISNRGYFMEAFNISFSYSRRHQIPLSVIIADLDLFKSINDKYGHNTGDKVLINFAKLLQEASREEDFPARFGGEEFTILLPQTELEEAAVLAERIRVDLENTKLLDINDTVTASFGVAQLKEGDTGDSLIQRADKALYQAKNQGRNKVIKGK